MTRRARLFLLANLVVGLGALAWALARFGRDAFGVLSTEPSPARFCGFLAAVAGAVLTYTLRWRTLLRGVTASPRLAHLLAYRAAGQSLSALLPGARLGGEPLRAWLTMRAGVPIPAVITTIVFDRTLEVAGSIPFVVLFAALLFRRNVPGLDHAVVSAALGALILALAVGVAVQRLRRGAGVVTAIARWLGLTRLGAVRDRLSAMEAAEDGARRLLAEPARMTSAVVARLAAGVFVLLEYHFLLAAFALPAEPIAVVAAIFAAGAARALPVPGAVGTLEGAQMWLFGLLGYPPEIGLAVGLAVRLRELTWIAPGVLYLVGRTIALRREPAPQPSA